MKKTTNMLKPIGNRLFFTVFWLAACMMLSQCTQNSPESIRVLIVGGGESHDFDTWFKEADSKTLRDQGLATVTYTDNTDSIAEYISAVDVLYLTNNQPISDPAARKAIFDFAEAGKGLVLGHAALWYNWSDWPEYNQRIVGGGSRGHDKYGPFNVEVTHPNHPVMQGVDQQFSLEDELYYFKVDEEGPGIEILAEASTEGSEAFPSVFVIKHPNTKIVGIALGHDGESHNLEAYQTILRNAVKWVAE